MKAFLSYQTQDKQIAAEVRAFLDSIPIPSFMAHEDIDVSHEWQEVILKEIVAADIFVAILSNNYLSSYFCLQESGIAVLRKMAMTIIPLSIDGSVSPGFMGHIQSRRIQPGNISEEVLFAGVANYNAAFAIDCLVNRLGSSRNYRSAEENFQLLLPYLLRATGEQIVNILAAAADNSQISNAALCAREYLPPLFASHGHLLSTEVRTELGSTLRRYAAP
jgi:hypothetical protein